MKYFYKIIAAVMALAVIPALIASPILYYRVQSTAMQALLAYAQTKNNKYIDEMLEPYEHVPDTLTDDLSVRDAYTLLTSLGKITSSIEEVSDDLFEKEEDSAAATNEVLERFKTPLITTAILGVMLMICGIVTAAFAIFSKNNRKAVYGSLAGIGLSVMFMFSFDSLVAPFMNGEVSIAALLNAWWASLIAQIEDISLSSSFYIIPALFVGIIVWTAIYNFTLPPEEKLARKKMLGEEE